MTTRTTRKSDEASVATSKRIRADHTDGTISRLRTEIETLRQTIQTLTTERAVMLEMVAETRLELEADLKTQAQIIRERERDIALLGEMLQAHRTATAAAPSVASPVSEAQRTAVIKRLQARKTQIQRSLRAFRFSKTHREIRGAMTHQAELIAASPLFDEAWYRKTYPDLNGVSDIRAHFVRFGVFEGRNPGPDFDVLRYYCDYPEVAEAGMCALVHYIVHGKDEGRIIHPVAEAARTA